MEKQEGTVAQIHKGGAGEFLSQRTWSGLDPNMPSDYPIEVLEGRTGIASQYTDEVSER